MSVAVDNISKSKTTSDSNIDNNEAIEKSRRIILKALFVFVFSAVSRLVLLRFAHSSSQSVSQIAERDAEAVLVVRDICHIDSTNGTSV